MNTVGSSQQEQSQQEFQLTFRFQGSWFPVPEQLAVTKKMCMRINSQNY